MTAIFSYILGYDPALVKVQTHASRQKVVTSALLLMLPVAVWLVSGYLLIQEFSDLPQWVAVVGGVACAGMIFQIDRAFITAPKTGKFGWLGSSRFAFALLSAVLGSMVIDMFFFQADIKNHQSRVSEKILEAETAGLLAKDSADYAKHEADIASARLRLQEAEKVFVAEMDGRGGGSVGYGRIARQKEKLRNDAEQRLLDLEAKYATFKQENYERAHASALVLADKSDTGVMERLHDFHDFVLSDKKNMLFYGLFLFILLFMETMPLMMKWLMPESAFEKWLVAQDRLREKEIEAAIRRQEHMIRAREILGRDNVNDIMRKAG